MARLILIAAFIAAVAIAFAALIGTMRAVKEIPAGKENGMLPGNLSRITYVLLLILLFGVTSGLLGTT
jgi:hypothetical protein